MFKVAQKKKMDNEIEKQSFLRLLSLKKRVVEDKKQTPSIITKIEQTSKHDDEKKTNE